MHRLWRVQEWTANVGRRLFEHCADMFGVALAEAERAQEDCENA